MITKKQAGLLYSYGFNLVDKEGKQYVIDAVGNDGLTLVCDGEDYHVSADAKDFGDFIFVLCRPYSQLTEEIEHGGERFKPSEILGYSDASYALDYLVDEIEKYSLYSSEMDALLTWNFKPQWLDEKFVKYI